MRSRGFLWILDYLPSLAICFITLGVTIVDRISIVEPQSLDSQESEPEKVLPALYMLGVVGGLRHQVSLSSAPTTGPVLTRSSR